ncbi:MAG: hypothetical protein HQM13_10785 [SAR324 cluster bacterium]|nr:hypothetical protein [SAR324 cluster bacterium]
MDDHETSSGRIEFMRNINKHVCEDQSLIFPGKLNHFQLAEEILLKKPVLKEKIRENCLIEENRVTTALGEVIRFLNLIAYSKKRLTPSKIIDLVWHEFILCTQTYDQFCISNFDRFIHHDPGESSSGSDRRIDQENHKQFRLTMKLYLLHFGTPSEEFWGTVPFYGAESNCGTCQTNIF